MRSRRPRPKPPDGIRLQKVNPDGCKTAYRVLLDGEAIGFVWSIRGFSYRGTEGWNRGIRIHDYHPIDWRYGTDLAGPGAIGYNRRIAIERLIESRREVSEAS